MKLPKYPKGLKARLNKLRRKKERIAAAAARKKEIAAMRAEVKRLSK